MVSIGELLRSKGPSLDEIAKDILTEVYCDALIQPILVTSNAYGYPHFEVRFDSVIQMNAVAIQNRRFKIELFRRIREGKLVGPKFNVDRSIVFTYPGQPIELFVEGD